MSWPLAALERCEPDPQHHSFLSLQHLWWSVLRICLIARSCEDHLKSFSQTVHLKKTNLFSTFCKTVSFAFQIWYDPSRNLVMTRLDKQNSGGFRSTISCFNAVALFAVTQLKILLIPTTYDCTVMIQRAWRLATLRGSSVCDFFSDWLVLLPLRKSLIKSWVTYFFCFSTNPRLTSAFAFFGRGMPVLKHSATAVDRSFCCTHNLSSTPTSAMRNLSPNFVSRLSKTASIVPHNFCFFFLPYTNIQMELITQTQYIFSCDQSCIYHFCFCELNSNQKIYCWRVVQNTL